MLGSTPSFSLSVAPADAGSERILKGAAAAGASASALALVPRRNGPTSRALRGSRAHSHSHPGLMHAPHWHPHTVSDSNSNRNSNSNSKSNNSNSSTDGLSGGRPASESDSRPAPTTTARSSVPVLAITCGAVGGIIALAVVLALVYVRRIRRRVKSMKRRTNVLGPELAPMSPSQLSHVSTPIDDSPRVKFDGKRTFSPRSTSEMTNHLHRPLPLPPLSALSVSSSTSLELPGIVPLSPIRTSTFILSPPPAAARRSTIRPSNPIPIPIPIPIPNPHSNPHSNLNPRSPIRSSYAAVPWPLVSALSSGNHPHPHHFGRRTEHKL